MNGIQIHLSMKVEIQPQQTKEYSINLHLLFKGTSQRVSREGQKTMIEQWSDRLWIIGEEKEKKRKYWMCLMKMLHHVCLIPFCIIDMNYWYDSCKVFFKQLNNLLLSMLPQRVPDLDKKLNSTPPLFFSLGLSAGHGPFAFEPPYEETCNALWTKMKEQDLVLT